MNAVAFIAKRYLQSKRLKGQVHNIQRISIIGVAVGSMALLTVLSAFNGLEDLIRSFYAQFDSDIKVVPKEGKYFLQNQFSKEEILNTAGITAVSFILEEKAFFRYGEKEIVARLKGVDSSFLKVNKIEEGIRIGDFNPKREEMLIGIGLAYKLEVYFSEQPQPIQLFVPSKGIPSVSDWSSVYKTKRISPTAVFSIQPEFDNAYAFVPLWFAQELNDQQNNLSAIEIAIDSEYSLTEVQKKLQSKFGSAFEVLNRDQQQKSVFKVLKSEGLMTYLILALTLGIACFTILGALAISMVEKRQNLFTLWSLGMSRKRLQRVFFIRGLQLTLLGGTIGIIGGITLVWLQSEYGFIQLGQGYAVESYPVRLVYKDVFLVLLTLLGLGGASSWWGSRGVPNFAQTTIKN